MNVIGIYDGHNSNAALISNGSIIAAIEEERFSRIKNHDARVLGMTGPLESIRECLRHLSGKLDMVAVALEEPDTLQREAMSSFLASIKNGATTRNECREIDGIAVKNYSYELQERRINKIKDALADASVDLSLVKLVHVNHHRAHAASAYYTSGLWDALIVTLDGKGDNLCGTVAHGCNGKISTLHEIDYIHSLGHFYTAVTVALGFKALRHEGKVTGLAAHGKVNAEMHAAFQRLFQVVNGTIVGRLNEGLPLGPYPHTLYEHHLQRVRDIIKGHSAGDVAATAQQTLEDVVSEFVTHYVEKGKAKHLLVTGGLFANVRLNQRLAALEGLETFCVHPAMSDAGLGVGAALHAYHQQRDYEPRRLGNVFLGTEYVSDEIESLLKEHKLIYEKPDDIEDEVARLLADGEVVCRCVGRMEYGPRSLGNRSILYRTNDPSSNTWLNRMMNRTETMPFAPATLDEHMRECYASIPASRASDEFMTITYQCTDFMRLKSPGVVHLDGSARPQRVVKAHNPSFHAILSRYHALTGIPSLINTSFNLHEEPIVCSPPDAMRAFLQGGFRYMQLGPFLVRS